VSSVDNCFIASKGVINLKEFAPHYLNVHPPMASSQPNKEQEIVTIIQEFY
jgi:hypothetical protein